MSRVRFAIGAVAFLTFVKVERAAAQIPACYVPGSGTVYVINTVGAPTACATGHIPVNLQGVQGPPGPSGVATVVQVEKDSTMGPGTTSFLLTCPAGTTALSSGYSLQPFGSPFGVGVNERAGDSWIFTIYNVSNPAINVTAQVLVYCGSP